MPDNKDIEENTHIFNLLEISGKFRNLSKNSTLTNFIIHNEWINLIIQIAFNRHMKNKHFQYLPKICIPFPLSKKRGCAIFGFSVIGAAEAEKLNKEKLLNSIENAFNKDSWKFYFDQIKHLENCDLLQIDYNKEIESLIDIVTESQKSIKFPE